MSEVIVEDVIAQPDIRSAAEAWKESVVGKLFGERECAQSYLLPDGLQALVGTSQIGFRRRTPNRGAISNAVDREVEHDPSTRRDRYAAGKPLGPQGTYSGNQSAEASAQRLQSRTHRGAGEGIDDIYIRRCG